MKRALFWLSLLSLLPVLHADDAATPPVASTATIATYPEIPYYVRQLGEATSERRRVELTKIIHEAVVNADLSNKRVVKAMEPMIAKIRISMDSGLDRAYLEGSSLWLGSAVDYFERDKLQPTVEIAQSDWLNSQTTTADGGRLTITPEKIWLVKKDRNILVAESSNIHEAVITPDGKRAAFIRELNDGSQAEIWSVKTKNRVRKKLTSVKSALTLVIASDGDRIFYQEKPTDDRSESVVWAIGFSGGKPKKIGQARLLQTLVAKGPHKNALVVFKNREHHLGTTVQECGYVWDERGHNIGRIKKLACR
jgi:hypothetical protein